jgi:sulfur carrier protein
MASEPSMLDRESRPRGAALLAVHLNGEPRQTGASTLADLVAEAGYGDARIATALNGDFVPARARATTRLKSGDHIEIVAPRQGG